MKKIYFLSLPCLAFAVLHTSQASALQFTQAKENFERVQKMILSEHLGDVDETQLYHAATVGMVQALNENKERKWNQLLTPDEMREFRVNLKGEVTGIGIRIQFLKAAGTAYVEDVLAGSPADQAEIQPGDQILSVNGKNYKGLTQSDLAKDIRGPVGESVQVKILRGDQVLEKKIERKKVAWGPVDSKVIKNNIGLLKIHQFTQKSPELVKTHLQKMASNEEKLRGLVVDLRNNYGGIFDKAVSATDHLTPKGKTIAILRGRKGQVRIFKAQTEPIIAVPIVVLMNRKTSAGAEMMAVSLKENLQARLVGEKTFGKWNSQVIRRLPNNFAVKYTVHEFLSPKKNCYKNVGLAPDVNVVEASPLPEFMPTSLGEGTQPMTDRQLQTALQIMKMMI